MIQGLIVLNNPDYVPQRWQGTLLFYMMIFLSLFFNTYLVKQLPKIEGLILIIHIAGFFGVLIPLVYLAPHGSASDVFGTFANGGGWSSKGLSFFVGIVTGVYAFLGADSACHMGTLSRLASMMKSWVSMTMR
jgi:choline transport protein